MKTQLIAALLVAVSASAAVPAFADEAVVSRAQVRAELVQLEQAVIGRAARTIRTIRSTCRPR